MSRFLASVVIPGKNRPLELERAIQSVINLPYSERVEIIVVDDGSEQPLLPCNLRSSDTVIRNPASLGAAISRNIGLNAASGSILYLLDSDDRFIARDFFSDEKSFESGVLYYSEISSQGYRSSYPESLERDTYLNAIFSRYPHVTQTSSLAFRKDSPFRFDESLPKHQDWDFVFCGALSNGVRVKRFTGETFFDRADKSSLSRVRAVHKSDAWYEKLITNNLLNDREKELVFYQLFAMSGERIGWKDFITRSAKLSLDGDLTVDRFAKNLFRRVF